MNQLDARQLLNPIYLWNVRNRPVTKQDISEVIFATGIFCVYFFILHILSDQFGRHYYPAYKGLKENKKTEYRSYLLSPLHSVVAVTFSVLGCLYSCDEGNIFTNVQCLNTPRFIHIWALQHTCAWFIVDTFFMAAVIRGTSAFDMQMYAHHFVSVFTWYSTLYFMNFTVVVACAILFVESSTIFVATRWLLYTHELQESVYTSINTVLSFLTFFFFRFVYMWVLCAKYLWPLLIQEYKTSDLKWWQVTLVFEQFIAVTLSAILNSYWMFLILKQLGRLILRKMGVTPPESEGGTRRSRRKNVREKREKKEQDGGQPADDAINIEDERESLISDTQSLISEAERKRQNYGGQLDNL